MALENLRFLEFDMCGIVRYLFGTECLWVILVGGVISTHFQKNRARLLCRKRIIVTIAKRSRSKD